MTGWVILNGYKHDGDGPWIGWDAQYQYSSSENLDGIVPFSSLPQAEFVASKNDTILTLEDARLIEQLRDL